MSRVAVVSATLAKVARIAGRAALGLALVLVLAHGARADTFKFTSAALTIDSLGRNPDYPGNFDILALQGLDGQPITLTPGGGPVTAVISHYVFTAGANRWDDTLMDHPANPWGLTFDLGGGNFSAGSLNLSLQARIGAADTLYFLPGTPTPFDATGGNQILVTLLPALAGPNGGGSVEGDLSATFELIPEPASMVLLGTGLVGLAARLRRRKQ